eukprot:241815_1
MSDDSFSTMSDSCTDKPIVDARHAVIQKKQRMLVEYWCRTVLHVLFINDIIDIMLDYAHIDDVFDASMENPFGRQKNLSIEKKGSVLLLENHEGRYIWRTGFGTLIATKGSIYRWRIKVVEGLYSIMIGVVEKDACENIDEYWWARNYGYGYFSGQSFYHSRSKEYGRRYRADDTIEVILDLKEYNISFSKNKTVFEKASDIDEQDSDYKLAISFYEDGCSRKSVEIVSVDIE